MNVSESQTVLEYLTRGHMSFIWSSLKKKGELLCTGINIVINYFGLSLFTNYCTCYLGISRFPEECF